MKIGILSGKRLVLGVLCGGIVLGLFAAGCDQGKDIKALTVTPAHVELTQNNETVRFSVTDGLRDLSFPLTWDLSNRGIGSIVAREGADAEYVRLAPGVNIVMVRDQYGAEGYATVTTPGAVDGPGAGYNLLLTANPETTIPEGINTVQVKVINGEPPFRWSVGNADKGRISAGGSGDTVIYESLTPGENTVICYDGNNVRGTIVITQLPLP